MAWSTPKIFLENEVLTAADLNQYLRDNLLENEVMKATTAGSRLSTDTQGNLVERTVSSDYVDTTESRPSGAMVQISPTLWEHNRGPYNLGTPGPTVTVQTGTRAIAFYSATMKTDLKTETNTIAINIGIGVDVVTSSSNRLTADHALNSPVNQARGFWIPKSTTHSMGMMCHFSGLTPGLNTFTMRYFVENPEATLSGSTVTGWTDVISTFSHRKLMILPL